MKRKTAKEIIAHAFYQIRKEAEENDMPIYGNAVTDQYQAEKVISFFLEEEDMESWIRDKTYEDYKIFENICKEIDEPKS